MVEPTTPARPAGRSLPKRSAQDEVKPSAGMLVTGLVLTLVAPLPALLGLQRETAEGDPYGVSAWAFLSAALLITGIVLLLKGVHRLASKVDLIHEYVVVLDHARRSAAVKDDRSP